MPEYDELEDDPPTATPTPTTIATLARPDVPVSLMELAALKGEALEIIEARITILTRVRKAALQATTPSDWVLFRTRDGQVTAYLQDAGAERVRDLFGIRIFNVSKPEKIPTADPNLYHYIVTADGACALTRQVIERIEGGRSSDEDFCKDATGIEREKKVRKAARANVDGAVVRELAGLSNVAIEEIAAAWEGTKKTTDRCPRGRGFGSGDERVGGRSATAPDVDPPVCPHCKSIGAYRPGKGDRRAFYGCPKWDTHKDKKFIIDAERWIEEHTAKNAAPTADVPAAAPAPEKVTPDPADRIFGNKTRDREPGEEG